MLLRPQAGPQEAFLSTPADIGIFGGGAGGGKTLGLLMEPLRHAPSNKEFAAVFFRRTTKQIRNPGGLWDESNKFYGAIPGAQPLQEPLEWRFSNAGKVKFAHLEHETDKNDWQGSQIPLICWDELTHFTESQFWYLVSRNRSMCGVRPYIRATCNPDADSWVATLIAWWIDQDTGFPIPERSGVLRWFIRDGDVLLWADKPEDLPERRTPDGQIIPSKSLTFIPSLLTDNPALMAANPDYYGSLMALPRVERERLLGGNWKIRPAAGLYFQRRWCEVIDVAPARLSLCRGWDLAATPETPGNDPDWTCGTLMGRTLDGEFVVMDQVWLRGGPSDVQKLILNTASQDPRGTVISLPQDPGQAGKVQALDFTRKLSGYTVRTSTEARNPGGDATPSRQSAKITRFSPFSAQCEGGNVKVLRGEWNKRWFEELEAFPEARHDDAADSTSRAYAEIGLKARAMRFTPDALALIKK